MKPRTLIVDTEGSVTVAGKSDQSCHSAHDLPILEPLDASEQLVSLRPIVLFADYREEIGVSGRKLPDQKLDVLTPRFVGAGDRHRGQQ